MRRKICIVTGSRSDYSSLKPLLDVLKKDDCIRLQIIATGMHLASVFGLTYKEIEQDNFTIDEKIEILLSSDTATGVTKSMGLALIAFSEAYERLKPHIIVGLGDRFELFAAISAAVMSRIPIAHIGGGDITEASIDDSIRHAISKMSHLHFVATELHRKRIIQMGESPENIFVAGELSLDNIKKTRLMHKQELEACLGFSFERQNFLVTFHPVTLEPYSSERQFKALMSVLKKFECTKIIFTKANADIEGGVINNLIDDYVSRNPKQSIAFSSLGRLKYLSLLQYVDGVIGNSSSGLVEAPSFKIGTINIGDRQKGRIKANSVIDCEPTAASIKEAIRTLFSVEFKKSLEVSTNPYGNGNSAEFIKKILKDINLEGILKKRFNDLHFTNFS